ncbi:oxidoreductase [Halobacteriales archaeon QH_3_68_24]|nr:MAG: oxidoreductase [Halobacteriales archaeon QH_3_68_24]
MTLANTKRYSPSRVSTIGNRAVVIGASMAGLSAARVLADGFEEVIVIDRDDLPEEPVARKGTPQTSHPHVLLEAGRATLEDLFPGFGADVLAEGGLMVDSGTKMEHFDQGGYMADTQERLPTYCASRPLFDHVLRHHVSEIENVQLRGNQQFTDYLTDSDTTSVTGVTLREEDGTEATISADLVVDATGRMSRTPQWLEKHGYDAPPVDEVQIDVTYSSIQIERPSDDRRMFFVPPSSPRTRGGGLIPIEGDRWDVIIQGVHGDKTPTDPGQFIEFTESLPIPELGQLVKSQTWATDEIEHYPYPSSIRRHYEELTQFPDNLVVTGDAIASFNPINGQGMSVAALDALQLHHTIARDGLDDVARRFFDRTADTIDIVWQMSVGADFDFPQTTGPKPRGTDLFNRYLDRFIRKAHSDPVLSEAFLRVMRLEKPPKTLLQPHTAWRVLRPTGGLKPPRLFATSTSS